MKSTSPALINFLNEVIGYDGQLIMADAFLFAP
jgi:hypothetical protein